MQIRRRALVILNGKLVECRATISHEEANLFVGLTSNLSRIVTSSEVRRGSIGFELGGD